MKFQHRRHGKHWVAVQIHSHIFISIHALDVHKTDPENNKYHTAMHEINEYVATRPTNTPIIPEIDANATPIANRSPYTGNDIDHDSTHSNHSRENLMTMLEHFDNTIQQTHQCTNIHTRHQGI